MAFPVILVDNAGSDTNASGAGPSTAVTGTKARTRSAAAGLLRVGFFESSAPDLSGVSATGSHALYVKDSVAGNRNFDNIKLVKDTQQTTTATTDGTTAVVAVVSSASMTAGDIVKIVGAGGIGVDLYTTIVSVDSAIQITVADNTSVAVVDTLTNPKQVDLVNGVGQGAGGIRTTDTEWAIGGMRDTIGSTSSIKLFNNNSAAGDVMPGWIVELQNAYTETIAATYSFLRSGTSVGLITLRGVAGAGTRPILTFSNNGDALSINGFSGIFFDAIDFKNTNATKTASRAVFVGSSSSVAINNCKVADATNNFWRGFIGNSSASSHILIEGCEIAECASLGTSNCTQVRNSYVHDNGGVGITLTNATSTGVNGCIVAFNGGDGIQFQGTSTDSLSFSVAPLITNNTIHGNTGDGVECSAASTAIGSWRGIVFQNNIITANGGFGFNATGAGVTTEFLLSEGVNVRNNCIGTGATANTSGGFSSNLDGTDTGSQAVDPQFVNAAGGDFEIGTNLKALGFPTGNYLGTSTRSYEDIGALQREEAGGGSGGSFTFS